MSWLQTESSNPMENPLGNPIGNTIRNPIGNPRGNLIGNLIGNQIDDLIAKPKVDPLDIPIDPQKTNYPHVNTFVFGLLTGSLWRLILSISGPVLQNWLQ
jgi:hypothetical protein